MPALRVVNVSSWRESVLSKGDAENRIAEGCEQPISATHQKELRTVTALLESSSYKVGLHNIVLMAMVATSFMIIVATSTIGSTRMSNSCRRNSKGQ
jgi:hypothetical protein